MKYCSSLLLIFLSMSMLSTDALFSNKKTEENSLKSFVRVIGGSEKVADIKKVFGFDVVEALKALLNYERKTNVQGKFHYLYE